MDKIKKILNILTIVSNHRHGRYNLGDFWAVPVWRECS